MRRKPAAVLMFLVTRPGFAANREQVVDELWPEADPTSGANNLNQSLYFLRRDIDPWYEDDVSVEYVGFQGDVVWLDDHLVRSESVEFVRSITNTPRSLDDLTAHVLKYPAPFAPEFEYDEWAMAWRARVHSTFLAVANQAIAGLVARNDLQSAADVAAQVVRIDPSAADVEYRLVWLYGRLRSESAARAQYDHLVFRDRLDGLEPPSYADLIGGSLPD